MQAKITTKIMSYFLNSLGGLLICFRRHYQRCHHLAIVFAFQTSSFAVLQTYFSKQQQNNTYISSISILSQNGFWNPKNIAGTKEPYTFVPQYLIWSIRSDNIYSTILAIYNVICNKSLFPYIYMVTSSVHSIYDNELQSYLVPNDSTL